MAILEHYSNITVPYPCSRPYFLSCLECGIKIFDFLDDRQTRGILESLLSSRIIPQVDLNLGCDPRHEDDEVYKNEE